MAASGPLTFYWLESDAQLRAAFDVMHELRSELVREQFVDTIRKIQYVNGYRMVGGFVDGSLVCLAGVHSNSGLSRGAHLRVDDLVVTESRRGGGAGRAMLKFLAAEARRLGIPKLLLDARLEAKPFYAKIGFEFRNSTPCTIPVEKLLD